PETSASACLVERARPPLRSVEAEPGDPPRDLSRFDQALFTRPVVRRADAAAAERRAEIHQVVPHVGMTVLGDERVERIDRLRVHVIQPRREHAVAAELAAILVCDQVVWIVWTRTDEPDAADRL